MNRKGEAALEVVGFIAILVVVISIVIAPVVISIIAKDSSKEISKEQYIELCKYSEKYPLFSSIVKSYMLDDGKITQGEMPEITNVYRRLQIVESLQEIYDNKVKQ